MSLGDCECFRVFMSGSECFRVSLGDCECLWVSDSV